MSAETLRIGFIPLLDCAIPVVAQEKGFAARHGLHLDLVRETSWAAIRDKVAFGLLDAAHMLAGIPIAATLGIGLPKTPMVAAMALGLGGNAMTVSIDLYRRMLQADPEAMAGPRRHAGRALAAVIAQDQAEGRGRRTFASVFPVSSHAYELRYWLASAGIDPDRDVRLTVIPPPRMVDSLRAGRIDGCCVGEPWNLVAGAEGLGAIAATKSDIWPMAPEKVLGLRADWAEDNGARLAALIRAFVEAAQWADAPENRPELARMLADPRYVNVPETLLRTALCGQARLRPDSAPEPLPHRPTYFAQAATFPWHSHALWLLTQMKRWGQIPGDLDFAGTAHRVYRPDIYRAALAGTGFAVPAADSKVEGGHADPYAVPAAEGPGITMPPDAFLDERVFDPADPEGYINGFEIGQRT